VTFSLLSRGKTDTDRRARARATNGRVRSSPPLPLLHRPSRGVSELEWKLKTVTRFKSDTEASGTRSIYKLQRATRFNKTRAATIFFLSFSPIFFLG